MDTVGIPVHSIHSTVSTSAEMEKYQAHLLDPKVDSIHFGVVHVFWNTITLLYNKILETSQTCLCEVRCCFIDVFIAHSIHYLEFHKLYAHVCKEHHVDMLS